MRWMGIAATVLTLSSATVASAQGWVEYVSRESGFRLNFPVQPTISDTTFRSEYGYMLPARVYSAERGRERYSITVVDYRGIEKLGTERSKACPSGAETCKGSPNTGPGYWKMEVGGAITYAQWQFLQRDARLTHLTWQWQDFVEGLYLQLTSNTDASRTFAAIHMHENRLYIIEATVPKGAPEPGLFQQSMGFVTADGSGIRYQTVYSNLFPPPPRTRGGEIGATNPR
jgi:hypothetical protein